MIRLLLVRDDTLVAQGLRMRLTREPDITIVGEASNGAETVSLIQTVQPDVIVMDQVMPDFAGLASLRAICSECAIVVLSPYDEDSTRAKARAAGAADFVGKHEGMHLLLAAIRQVGKR